jgi:hypothetical protein
MLANDGKAETSCSETPSLAGDMECEMYTSAECRAHAEEKLAQAERDDQNRKRLIAAAEGWLFLAGQMNRIEAAFAGDLAAQRVGSAREHSLRSPLMTPSATD